MATFSAARTTARSPLTAIGVGVGVGQIRGSHGVSLPTLDISERHPGRIPQARAKGHALAGGPALSGGERAPCNSGGLLSLLFPIPPATISFAAEATVHPGTSVLDSPRLTTLAALVPPERRSASTLIEIRPTGNYVTYGIGVPLAKMRDTTRSRARVPVV